MKPASAAMIALLANPDGAFYWVDLLTFTLQGGSVLRYNNSDINVVFGGNTYFSGQGKPLFDRNQITWKAGLEVDSLELDLYPLATDTINSVPVLQALGLGLFDNAAVEIDRLASAAFGDWSAGIVVMFKGNVADISEIGRTHAKITCKSRLQILNVPFPRNVFQPNCQWTLFDAGCTLSKAAFGVNGTVQAGSNTLQIVSGLTQPNNYFQQGTVTFTSGANSGQSISIRTFVSGLMTLYIPTPFPIANGDAFTAYPGCAKTMQACAQTNSAVGPAFNNLVNFGGVPFVPIPETAI